MCSAHVAAQDMFGDTGLQPVTGSLVGLTACLDARSASDTLAPLAKGQPRGNGALRIVAVRDCATANTPAPTANDESTSSQDVRSSLPQATTSPPKLRQPPRPQDDSRTQTLNDVTFRTWEHPLRVVADDRTANTLPAPVGSAASGQSPRVRVSRYRLGAMPYLAVNMRLKTCRLEKPN